MLVCHGALYDPRGYGAQNAIAISVALLIHKYVQIASLLANIIPK
jgi:hypothetical protein